MKYKESSTKNSNEKGLIVITGCDTGIGNELAKTLIRTGYAVALSYMRKAPFKERQGIYQKKMDLRNPEEIEEFRLFVEDILKTDMMLKAVVSNAGIAMGGPVENLPLSVYRDCFEVNFFGTVQIVKAFIPEIIHSRGRIIIVGSNAGKVAAPFLSPYASSKYAIEGFTDSLRRELKPFGVSTILLEPASVQTPIWNNAKMQDYSFVDEKYRKSFLTGLNQLVDGGNAGMKLKPAACQIAEIMFLENPKARYIISKNKCVTRLMQALPDFVLDRVILKFFHMKYGDFAD